MYTCVYCILYILYCILYIAYCILYIVYWILNIVYCICILYMYMYMYICIYNIYTYTGIVEGIYEKMIALLLVGRLRIARGFPWDRSSQLWPWSFWDRLRWSPESNKPHTGDLQKKTQTYTVFLTYPLNETYPMTNPSCLCLSIYIYIEILCIPHIPTNMNKQKYIPKFRVAPPVSPHKTAGRTVPSSGAF